MSRVCVFLADGFEEIEGLTVVDILRRAGIDISMISINGKKKVTGAHGIALDTDEDIVQCDLDKLDIGNDFYSTQEIYKKLVDRQRPLCYSEECYIMARICLFISNRKQEHVVK